ncbi:MAG: murein biosynthesis integral membrane protein MurJ [Chloroflexi bacterium]|nr:murein biosynthesis integral membrane protein MurJ [Chloroflexota bacterium]
MGGGHLTEGWRNLVRSVAIAAAVIALGNIVSRLLGLAREQVMAALFGATAATDAFVAASAVPMIVYDLLVGGAISAALVPVFVDAAEDEERLWRLLSTVLTLVALVLLGVALVLGLAAPLVVDVLASGFSAETRAAAVPMVRLMLVAVILQGIAGVLTGVLYARRRVTLPAFAVAVYNGGVILGALLLHEVLDVYALVLGVVLGALGQVLLQLPGLGRLRYRPALELDRPEVRAILKLYGPVAAGMIVTIAGIVIDRNLASGLAEGSLSVMNYATRLIQFPLGLVATATSFAVLPLLSKHASALAAAVAVGRADDEAAGGYRETLRFGARIVLLLMLPATVGLIVLREPLVQLLFERGRFGEIETARTALVFLAYAPQLPLTALDQLLIVAFYARKDTRTPVLVGVATVLLYLVSALALIGPLDVAGLALANAIQNSAHGVILLLILERSGAGLLDGPFVLWTVRVLVASVGVGVVVWLAEAALLPGVHGTLMLGGLLLGLAGVAGVVYLVLLELLGVRDGRLVLQIVRERAGRGRGA